MNECNFYTTLHNIYYIRISVTFVSIINPLTPELNPSPQRCLTRFLLVILLLEPYISLIYG
jgi:hypothetical protein